MWSTLLPEGEENTYNWSETECSHQSTRRDKIGTSNLDAFVADKLTRNSRSVVCKTDEEKENN